MLTHNYLKKTQLIYILSLFLLLSSLLNAATTIELSIDRDPIVLNEQFSLVFSAGETPDAEPDFSALKKDFDILQQGKSNSVQIINGTMSQKVTWTIQLFPKRVGTIEIPAIHFGSDKSEVRSIKVIAPSQATQTGTAEDIIVEVEVKTKSAYVQQQIVYIQRLYFARDFFDNATLSTPQLTKGKIDLEKLGSGREYTKMRAGRQYKVIERRYAIFPIQSGKIEIAPTFFEGRLIDNKRQNNFGFFNRPTGKIVRRYSAPISIDVKPQMANYTGSDWLPASRVTLHSHWSSPPEKAKTGEPLTLTLSIIANGLRAEQLPQLEVNVPTGLKTYNDQAVLNNESNSNGIIGTRQEKIVVIATQAGHFEIPTITLTWWDTVQAKQQLATIAAMTLTSTGVAANAAIIPTPLVTPITATTNKSEVSIAVNEGENNQAVANSDNTKTVVSKSNTTIQDDFWFYFSLFLLLTLILLLYLLWQQLNGQSPSKTTTVTKVPAPSLDSLVKQVHKACASHNHKALRIALCRWGSYVFQQPNINLHHLVEKFDESEIELKTGIQQLMQVLYASEHRDWDSQRLCQAIRQYTPKKARPSQPSRIASLYPE